MHSYTQMWKGQEQQKTVTTHQLLLSTLIRVLLYYKGKRTRNVFLFLNYHPIVHLFDNNFLVIAFLWHHTTSFNKEEQKVIRLVLMTMSSLWNNPRLKSITCNHTWEILRARKTEVSEEYTNFHKSYCCSLPPSLYKNIKSYLGV